MTDVIHSTSDTKQHLGLRGQCPWPVQRSSATEAALLTRQLILPVQWAALDAHTIYLHLTLHRAVDKTLLRGRRGAARGAAPSDSIQTRSRRPCPRERGEQVDPSGLSVRGGGLSPHPADRCTQPHTRVVLVAAWTPGGWRGLASAGILTRRAARCR